MAWPASAVVLSNREITPGHYLLVAAAPGVAEGASPGQFAHIRCGDTMDPLLRRPLSFHRIEPRAGRVTFLYRLVGRGTALLARKGEGEILDLLGPLGRGFPFPVGSGPAVLVGGGIGVAPLLALADALRQAGREMVVLLGARTRGYLPRWEEFGGRGSQLKVVTEDGSLGERGLVSDLLEDWLNTQQARAGTERGTLYACGPVPLLKKVQEIARARDLTAYLSLEERMACGVGACLSCACRAAGAPAYLKVCVDGPVFPAREVELW